MQLSRNDISEKLKEILVAADAKNKDIIGKVTESSNLRTDLGLNSVGMLYLVIVIEQSFGIEFDNVGMDDFQTFKDIVDYIEGKQ